MLEKISVILKCIFIILNEKNVAPAAAKYPRHKYALDDH